MIALLLYLRSIILDMESLLSKVHIKIDDCLYLKNPESSSLGKNIIKGSIELIHEIGFEEFTFKKLVGKIGSTEASIYRYFENKHKVLLYLTNWYWLWMEYRLVFTVANISSGEARLKKAIQLLTETVQEEGSNEHINVRLLYQIIQSESLKAYLTKLVDTENKEGAFLAYKSLVQRISTIITEINPNYAYPHMLVSTVIEGAHLQRHFADHLPRLTDNLEGEDSVTEFYQQIVFKAIQ